MPIPEIMSFEQLRSKITHALNPGDSARRWTRYVRELYQDRVIFVDENNEGELYEVTFSVTPEGDVVLGEERRVEMIYIAAKSSDVTGAPSEIQMVPFGTHKTAKGTFVLDEKGMKAIIEDFDSRKNDMVIDYEHQTLAGTEAPAAGWIKKLINKGKEGIWALVEWTPKAREYLKNKEYRYLSPVILVTPKESRVMRVKNAALTNQPAIDGMVPIVNKGSLNPEIKQKEENSMKELLKLLGLKDDATEAQAVEAVKGLMSQAALGKEAVMVLSLKEDCTADELKTAVAAMKEGTPVVPGEVLKILDLKDGATLSEVTGTITAMKQGSDQAGDLGKRLGEMELRLKQKDATDLVDQAMKEGKVTPAQKEWAMKYATDDPDGFKAYVAKAPVVVHEGEHAHKDIGGGVTVDGLQQQVNSMLGVSDETFKEHGPAAE